MSDNCVICNPNYMPEDIDYIRTQNDLIVYTNVLTTLNLEDFQQKIQVAKKAIISYPKHQQKEAEAALDMMEGLARHAQQYLAKAAIIMQRLKTK